MGQSIEHVSWMINRFMTDKNDDRNAATLHKAFVNAGISIGERQVRKVINGGANLTVSMLAPVVLNAGPGILNAINDDLRKQDAGNFLTITLPDKAALNGSCHDEVFEYNVVLGKIAAGAQEYFEDRDIDDIELRKGTDLFLDMINVSLRGIAELQALNEEYQKKIKRRRAGMSRHGGVSVEQFLTGV